jgi:hypothetical protein
VVALSTVKVFALGGLDKKSNDLTRAVDKASEMINLEYDTQSTIKKRNGYAEVSIDGSTSNLFDDIIYYNTKDEILCFKAGSSSVKVINNSTLSEHKINGSSFTLPSGALGAAVSISYCENQNNLYFTNTDYNTYVMKYDGSNIYRSGLPTPRNSAINGQDNYPSFTNTATGYTRIFYSQKDINGNITYSPYWQTPVAASNTSVLSMSSFKFDSNCAENGFLDKYCFRAGNTSATLTSGSNILTVLRHNYVAGEKFLMDTENKAITLSTQGKSFIVLEVQASGTDSTHIAFTPISIGTTTINFANLSLTEYPIDVRSKFHVAVSQYESTNYSVITYVLDNSVNVISKTLIGGESVLDLGRPVQQPFENIYDSGFLKTMPPICKYIASYGSQIVYGSIQSYFSGYTNTLNAPNQKIDFANTSLITYSDLSTGDGPEGVSDFNFTKIGETWDGDITGIHRCNDSLVVFKTRGIFTIDGELVDNQYTLRKITSNFVGCTSHKSILDAEEGLYFQAHNGIYYTNAVGVKKLTYELDSVFLSQDYNQTRAVRLKKKQKSLFYVPNIASGTAKIIIVDYYYNQVYTWSFANNPDGGILEDKNGDIYFCDGSKIYKINNLYSDNGANIYSQYSTTWHHCGEPALLKKFLSLRTWGLSGDAFTASITIEGDWKIGALQTFTQQYTSSDQTMFTMMNMQTKRSLRLTFSNNSTDDMVLTGYELTYEIFNAVDKN